MRWDLGKNQILMVKKNTSDKVTPNAILLYLVLKQIRYWLRPQTLYHRYTNISCGQDTIVEPRVCGWVCVYFSPLVTCRVCTWTKDTGT